MIKLYGGGASRWVKPYWALKELEVPFEPVVVSIMRGETRTPEYLKMNPFGKVPVLDDDGFTLFESLAICNYLADKYAEKGLAPKHGTKERALYEQWMSFAVSELEQPLWRIIRHSFVYPEGKRSAAEIELAAGDFRRTCEAFEAQINGPYLVGNRFTVADIAITYTLRWASMPVMPKGMVEPFPKLKEYLATHTARPKFPRELYPDG